MRRQKTRIFLIAAILLILCAGSHAEVIARQGKGWLELSGPYRILHLKGTPYEMGFQHGVLLKPEIHAAYEGYIKGLSERGGMFTEDKLVKVSRKYILKYLPPDFAEEIRGLADGAGLEYEKAFMLQTVLDIISVLWSNDIKGLRYLNMCSSVAVRAPGTRNGELIHARNIDFPDLGVLRNYVIVFAYEPDLGRKMVIIGWAGLLGALTGMNDAGVTLSEDTLSTREDDIYGVPIMLLLRAALQQADSARGLRDYLESQPRNTGYMVLSTSPENQSVILMEFNPKRFAAFEPDQGGVIFATNHPRDPGMMSVSDPSPNSRFRWQRWETITGENAGKIDVDTIKSFLKDTFDMELGKSTDPASNTICTDDNIQSAIFLPESKEFFVSHGTVPAAMGEWAHYRFDDLFVDTAAEHE